MILAAVCRSSANAQLLGDSHPAEVADLLVALSRPDALLSRGQTLMQLFAALAPVLWTTHDGAELWERLRAAPSCDGFTQYLWKESLALSCQQTQRSLSSTSPPRRQPQPCASSR